MAQMKPVAVVWRYDTVAIFDQGDSTTGTFTLSLSSPTTLSADIIVTNIIGQKIKEFTTTTNKQTEITLDSPPGIYFVTSVTNEGRQTAKLIIE